jgi:hypothetical protein
MSPAAATLQPNICNSQKLHEDAENGVRWDVARTDTGKIVLVHTSHKPSGWQRSMMDVGTFLAMVRLGPAHDALLAFLRHSAKVEPQSGCPTQIAPSLTQTASVLETSASGGPERGPRCHLTHADN